MSALIGFQRNCPRSAFVLLFLFGGFATATSALARVQSETALVERFSAECLPRFVAMRRQGKDIHPQMVQCVMDKLGASWSPPSELRLFEYTPWLIKNSGPSNAKGVAYFILGWDGRTVSDQFHLVPYFLKSLNDAGWDVIGAKVPDSFSFYLNPRLSILSGSAAPFVRDRIKQLKDQGYRRIALMGHSWGGWVAMQPQTSSQADALVLASPANYGNIKFLRNGDANPYYAERMAEFGPMLRTIMTPTTLIFIDNDELNPSEQSAVAKSVFEQSKIPHHIIDRPPGFTGHYASWFPVFDYAYGKCIRSFLDDPNVVGCRPPALSNNDFRSIVHINQVADADKKRITSAEPLLGKKFGMYSLLKRAKYLDYVSLKQRITLESEKGFRETVVFRDGLHCVGTTCTSLIRWSETEVLEFNSNTGSLEAWWIEYN